MPHVDDHEARGVFMDGVRALVQEELERFSDGFEARLAQAFRKALDTVTEEFRARVRSLEEDQARILRHLGLEGDGDG